MTSTPLVRAHLKLRVVLALVLAALASCVTANQDLALAPLVTRISTAGGGSEVEALAGIVRRRHALADGPLREWALMPFVKETLAENGDRRARFLVPLGTREESRDRFLSKLLPIWRFERSLDAQGRPKWSLVTLPLTYWVEDESGRVARAVFPLGGVLERFLTFDRVEFALFPLYVRTWRDGQVSTSFLWPVFNWTNGPLGTSYRVWPLYGRLRQHGRFDRHFVLWPFFSWGRDHLSTAHPEWRWMFWPLVGHRERGTYHAETFLWPFFGWASDSKSGFWAWDGPWPLVRFLRPGKDDPDGPRRSRVWPFWSSYRGDGLTSHWVLWPIVNWRESVDMLGTSKSLFVNPVWQHWRRVDKQGVESSWTKLWPLFQDFRDGDQRRAAFPALNPLWHLPEIDEHYAWIYELVTREVDGGNVSDRVWGNLYRREKDQDEDRAYLSFLWSRRAYQGASEPLVEHSLLFGLLRWRTHPARSGFSFDPMLPAFPGPGWPLARERAARP
ncbi:MAG TPA: hypothetical protein VM509_14835 [Planctomycetota bacterium]|nr:hypothetical protein [Planctomycetota bacterium]